MEPAAAKIVIRRGPARMFESDFLERFSHVHPAMPALLYCPVVIAASVVALRVHGVSPGRLGLELLAGYAGWTVFEYWAHRLVFHMPVVGPRTQRLQFLIHGVHHEHPWDEGRLVIPPTVSLVLCVLTYAGFHAALGASAMHGPFAGFVLGYVLYDELHWYIHARQPSSRFGRWLRREHFIHHFKQPGTRFGVSCPWLDHCFGTSGSSRKAARDTEPQAAE